MNAYERVMTAMRGAQPDRVPVVESAIDPKVSEAILPGVRDQGDLAEHLDLDNVGCGAAYRRVTETKNGWIDEWGVRYVTGPEIVDHPVEGPIREIGDLAHYEPPDPDAPHRLGLLPEMVRRYKGRRAIVFHHRAAFMWSAFVTGLEDLLMAFAAEPDFAEAVMDVVVGVNERVARNAVRAGADIVTLADDYASNMGPLFSRAHFEQLVLPRLQRVVDAVHEEGGLVVKHSDGDLWPILDLIVDTGADGLNPIEPVANMDIGEVKRQYGDRICIIGNIDCGALLSHGTTEQVEAAVQKCIADAAKGGGFMLSSSNSIHSSVKPENYVAMVKAGQRFGAY
ncbi:MAG: hypothetical protein CMJ18_10990 [Phycisphaeraceae bacterium]|nr:hypothetical protein [Phycisphaeraceae bacterium]